MPLTLLPLELAPHFPHSHVLSLPLRTHNSIHSLQVVMKILQPFLLPVCHLSASLNLLETLPLRVSGESRRKSPCVCMSVQKIDQMQSVVQTRFYLLCASMFREEGESCGERRLREYMTEQVEGERDERQAILCCCNSRSARQVILLQQPKRRMVEQEGI